jgi:hypothetical protein
MSGSYVYLYTFASKEIKNFEDVVRSPYEKEKRLLLGFIPYKTEVNLLERFIKNYCLSIPGYQDEAKIDNFELIWFLLFIKEKIELDLFSDSYCQISNDPITKDGSGIIYAVFNNQQSKKLLNKIEEIVFKKDEVKNFFDEKFHYTFSFEMFDVMLLVQKTLKNFFSNINKNSAGLILAYIPNHP